MAGNKTKKTSKMKNEISSLELHYLIRELKILEGSKIDRIYHSKSTPKELVIGCHITGQGKKILRTILPSIIFLDDTKDASDSPTGFGMMLRKYLEGGRIKSIEQKDFERVITITLENKKDSEIYVYIIVLELFSKGNIIFCDGSMKILNILEEQSWKDRTLKRNEIYKYPNSRTNTLTVSEDEFKEKLSTSGKESLVKALAITFNLGGTYSEELCHMSGVAKEKNTKDITDKEYDSLYKNLILLLHKEDSPRLCDGNAYPFALGSMKFSEMKEYGSFSEAIKFVYENVKHSDSKRISGKNVEKIQNVIDEQLKLLKECEEGYAENQAKGEMIYAKYQEIDSIMKTVKEARKKYSWKAIRQKLDDNPEFKKLIKDIDEKNSSIIIEIEK